MATFRIREASNLLGVSTDTLRRWADAGRIKTITDASGRLAVDGAALAKLAQQLAEPVGHETDQAVVAHSARNRFRGLVTRVVRDTVMAQVEIQAGQHRFVSLLSREAADELGLEPGMLAVAAIKSTNVSIEIPGAGPTRSSKPPHQLAVLSTPNAAAGPTAPGTSRSRRPGFQSQPVRLHINQDRSPDAGVTSDRRLTGPQVPVRLAGSLRRGTASSRTSSDAATAPACARSRWSPPPG